jgi:hypothetical protein
VLFSSLRELIGSITNATTYRIAGAYKLRAVFQKGVSEMAVLEMETMRRKGAVKGRESRNQTLTTKLTPIEAAAVMAASERGGKTIGEWLRDLALKELHGNADELSPLVLMGEVTAIRLLLINTLEPLLRGDRMTPEQFKDMLRYVKTNKRKAAADTLASYTEGTTEQL